jgi:hypothetical protein
MVDMYDMAFHQVSPNKKTIVPYVKRVQELLPAPWKTNCYNYSDNKQNLSSEAWEDILSDAGKALTSHGLQIYRTRGEWLVVRLSINSRLFLIPIIVASYIVPGDC